MLSHAPLGLGNPYRHEPDQRIPSLLIAGEPWKVRATTDPSIKAVHLHIQQGSQTQVYELQLIGAAFADTYGPYGKTAKTINANTHLTELVSKAEVFPGLIEWEIELPALSNYEEVNYWLENDTGERTDSYQTSALVWSSDEDQYVQFDGVLPIGITATEKKVLKNSSGQVFRTRFTLPLAPNDHVIGFGERFHSIDQRGELVDAMVYEEYKGHGHRTYLPAPFGTIIGSDYGFYVNSANPSRYDIGVAMSGQLLVEVDTSPLQSNVHIKTYVGSPTSILRQYMSEFTLPEVPPSWIYKLWGSSNEWNTQARVEMEIKTSASYRIDIGVVVIEAWSDESTFTVFRDAQFTPNDGSKGLRSNEVTYPSEGAWPDPQKMIDEP